MPISVLFIDLDDTLYPRTNGLWGAIRERMSRFMREQVGLPEEEIPELRRRYFETYGTTLRGLQIHHSVDPEAYLAYVHDLPLDSFLAADARLRKLLLSLPQPKWIFTNADAQHARRVLSSLCLSECFQGIIDVQALQYACKPEPTAYLRAMQIAGETDPRRCLMADDSARNLAPAFELGFTTVLVGSGEAHPAAHYSMPSLLDLRQVLPELLNR